MTSDGEMTEIKIVDREKIFGLSSGVSPSVNIFFYFFSMFFGFMGTTSLPTLECAPSSVLLIGCAGSKNQHWWGFWIGYGVQLCSSVYSLRSNLLIVLAFLGTIQ